MSLFLTNSGSSLVLSGGGVPVSTSPSIDIYVSQSGTGDGSSPDTPRSLAWFNTASNWANPKEAGKIGPGDVVGFVGTITGQVTVQGSGSAGSSIQLVPYASAAVQCASSPVLSFGGHDYITVYGLALTYTGSESTPYVVYNAYGSNIDYPTIQNCTLTLAGGSGQGCALYLGSSDYATVSGTTISVTSSTGSHDGAAFLYASHLSFTGNTISGAASASSTLQDALVLSGTNLNIENNTIHDGWSYDYHPDGIVLQGDGDRASNHTANVTIQRNTIWNFSQGIYVDAIHHPIEGTNVIANNVIYETSDFRYGGVANKMNGIVIDGESLSGPYHAVACSIFNNTIDANQITLYTARLGTGSSVVIKNNVFLTPGYTGIYAPSVTGVELDYNYYSGADATPIHWNGTAYSLANFKSTTGQESQSTAGTAGLNSNYTVAVGSDVRNRGTNLSTSFTTDRAGTTRPSAPTAWDSGAYQYVS